MADPQTPAGRGEGRGDAYERALGALAHRERTASELSSWLAERGYSALEVEATVGRLIEIGELDDARFARRYAEDKRELSGWGEDRIRAALAARGLARGLIDDALVADEGSDLERAVELLARRGPPPGDDAGRNRALAYLARRGYDVETAYEAVRRSERRAA